MVTLTLNPAGEWTGSNSWLAESDVVYGGYVQEEDDEGEGKPEANLHINSYPHVVNGGYV